MTTGLPIVTLAFPVSVVVLRAAVPLRKPPAPAETVFPLVGRSSVKVFCAVMSTAEMASIVVLFPTVALALLSSVFIARAPLAPASAAFTELTSGVYTLLLAAVTSTVSAMRSPPPTTAETVELSLVLPTDASPAIRPPLPAVVVASFSSDPVAATVIAPVRELAVVAEPSWARVVTLEAALATSAPIASTPPTDRPVALADWRL